MMVNLLLWALKQLQACYVSVFCDTAPVLQVNLSDEMHITSSRRSLRNLVSDLQKVIKIKLFLSLKAMDENQEKTK